MSTHNADPLSDCGAEAANADSSGIPTTEIHAILSNERRLLFLEELVERGEAEFNDLVDHVAEREFGITPDDPDWADERKKVRVSLYQNHVERLRRDGIIDYRTKTGRMQLAENAKDVARYLDVDRDLDESHGLIDRMSSAFRAMCD